MSYETLINLPDSLVIVKYYDGQRFITSFQKRYVLKHVFDIRLPFYSGHVFPRQGRGSQGEAECFASVLIKKITGLTVFLFNAM